MTASHLAKLLAAHGALEIIGAARAWQQQGALVALEGCRWASASREQIRKCLREGPALLDQRQEHQIRQRCIVRDVAQPGSDHGFGHLAIDQWRSERRVSM